MLTLPAFVAISRSFSSADTLEDFDFAALDPFLAGVLGGAAVFREVLGEDTLPLVGGTDFDFGLAAALDNPGFRLGFVA